MRLINTSRSSAGSHHWMALSQCPRYYALSELAPGGRGQTPKQFIPGTLVHVGVAHWALGKAWRSSTMHIWAGDTCVSIMERVGLINDYYEPADAIQATADAAEESNPLDVGLWQAEVKRAQDTVASFVKSGMGNAYLPVGVEREYEIAIPNFGVERLMLSDEQYGFALQATKPIPYTARIDCVAIDDEGKIYFIDWKTSSQPFDAAVGQAYRLSLQLVGQWYIGEQVYGEQFGGVIIGAIQTQPPWSSLIVPIVQKQQVKTQVQLSEALLSQGYSVSTSTLGKELKALNIEKVKGVYVLPPGGVDALIGGGRQMELVCLDRPNLALVSFPKDIIYWHKTKALLKATYGTDYANYPRAGNPHVCATRWSVCPYASRYCDGQDYEIVFDGE